VREWLLSNQMRTRIGSLRNPAGRPGRGECGYSTGGRESASSRSLCLATFSRVAVGKDSTT
jgi:hypothetical protein